MHWNRAFQCWYVEMGVYPRVQLATAEQTSRQQIRSLPSAPSIIHQMVSMAWLMLMQMQQLLSGFSASSQRSISFDFLVSHTRRSVNKCFFLYFATYEILCRQRKMFKNRYLHHVYHYVKLQENWVVGPITLFHCTVYEYIMKMLQNSYANCFQSIYIGSPTQTHC